MITVKTYLRTTSADTQYGYVWVKFYASREKVNFSTGVKVLVKNWNEKKLTISRQDPEAVNKTIIISNILGRISNVFVKYRLKDKRITRNAFLRAYYP